MNFRFVVNQIGVLVMVLAGLLLLLGAWSLLLATAYADAAELAAFKAFLLAGLIGLGVGFAGAFPTRRCSRDLERREALLLVVLSWVVGAALAGAPFYIWALLAETPSAPRDAFASPINCYFEATSGLTTTGATILTGIHELPRSILLWRSATHWLGGLGIVVLFVAVLPSLGVAAKRMVTVEASGPSPTGVRPEIRETARVLLYIYAGLTLVQVVALRLAGMDWFDSVCHTFATVATGGFSTEDGSVGAFASTPVTWIIIVFMILAGANFGIYEQGFRRRFNAIRKDPEVRLYLTIILLAAGTIAIILTGQQITTTTGGTVAGPFADFEESLFHVVSIQTTTGFAIADFNTWPPLAKGILVTLMFIGGCAGSTAGGIKVIRIWIVLRMLLAEIERLFRPNVIRPMKIAGAPVDTNLKITTLAYVLAVIVLWLLGTGLLLAIDPSDRMTMTTAATASVATLCTIGPGLGYVGAMENYAWMSTPSKLLLTLWMLFGRLEVFTILVLLSPRFWRD